MPLSENNSAIDSGLLLLTLSAVDAGDAIHYGSSFHLFDLSLYLLQIDLVNLRLSMLICANN